MNQNENHKKNDRYHHRRNHGNNRNRNENHTEAKAPTKILENENKLKVELTQSEGYTRNLDPLVEGYRMPAITLFNKEEEEFDLSEDKSIKVYVTIPSFKDKAIGNEVEKLETILKEYPNIHCYLISNEPVFTQERLSKHYHFEKFRILSDFKNREFARSTGTYIYEISALVKSIFIVDKNERIVYVRYYDDLYSNFNVNEINECIQNNID